MVSANWSCALGHAGAAAVWRPADNQHPQRLESALARVAGSEEPLHRADDKLLRICAYDAA
jgi:hypothetical protein